MKRCQAYVARRVYSPAGQCQIENNVKAVTMAKGGRASLCTAHRRMAEDLGRVALTRSI